MRLLRIAIAVLLVTAVSGGAYVGVKWAYGGYGDFYEVSFDVPRTGQQLAVGSEVRLRGVVIGSVSGIQLLERGVRVTLKIERQYRLPTTTEAFIDLTTLLGAKFVDLRFDQYAPPFLADGDRLERGVVGPELEDALADGVRVLDAIRPNDLATIVNELARGAQGHGQDVARGLRANAELSTLFARTLKPQIRSLHDFVVLFGALKDKGPTLNELADAINQGVPVYASQQAQSDLRHVLEAVTPFANNLADLFIFNRADWDRLMDAGDVVLQTLVEHRNGLHDLVHGIYRYVFKLRGDPCRKGHGPAIECFLHDGSGAAGFVNFMGGNDDDETRRELCGALPPDVRPLIPACAENGG